MALFKIYLSDGITQLTNVKSVTFKETVNADEYLRPGCVGSAAIDVEVFNTQGNAVSAGDEVYCYHVDPNNTATLLGKFICEPIIATQKSYTFTAYDNTSKLNADFSQWLQANQSSFPMTVKALVTAACTAAGVTLGSSSWPLSNENVQAFYTDGLTCRDILSYAAEIAGRFVRCHTDGKVYFDWYASATDAIAPSAGTHQLAYKQDGLEYANYTTTALARVAVHPSGEDDVAYIYPTGVSSGNTLEITNNLLLTGASAALYNAVAQQVYTAVTAVGTYRPMSANLFPKENTIRAGDIVSVTDAQSVSFSSPVTSLTLNASTALIESEGRQEYEASTNTQKALVQLASDIVRINKLKVSWAEIDQAIIDELQANGINAVNISSSNWHSTEEWDNAVTEGNASISMSGRTFLLSGQSLDKSIQENSYADLQIWIADSGSPYIRMHHYKTSGTDTTEISARAIFTGAITATAGNFDDISLVHPAPISSGGTGANNATDALTNLGAVAKTGDTMSGELENTSYFTRKLPSAPVADTTSYYATRIKDQNNAYRGGLAFFRSSTYGDGIRIVHAKDVNGTTISNVVSLYISDSGTPYVAFTYPSAWRNGLGVSADYKAGDTVSFTTTGNEVYTRWAGDWRNTTDLYFTIPLTKPFGSLSASVTGTVYICSNGTRNSVTLSSLSSVACYNSPSGLIVRLRWASAPAFAVTYQPVTVQPYGFTITFS